ncbi:hypothetical protein F5B19DRAFT_497602 [Rostrohypoxylon terebratum]|nr:hypothetical protein F5B19DRAFT_497602 [Rostrohypoxylon terebratum]
MQSRSDSVGFAWKPGFLRQAPLVAFLGLLGFAVCCVGLGTILYESDGKEVSTWPRASSTVSVSVVLSLIIAIANLCLSVALGQGYAISWWLQALKGAEFRKLVFDLEVRSGLSAILGENMAIDKFVIATVVSLVVSILDGPLIQKASVITPKTYVYPDQRVTAYISNASLPGNFSGYGGMSLTTTLLTPLFSNVSRAYSNRDDIILPLDGCGTNSTCDFTLSAPGFDVNCTESSVPYNFTHLGSADPNNNNITTFNVSFAFGGLTSEVGRYNSINTTSWYKTDGACIGSITKRECVLSLATVRYSVSISNGITTLQNWQLGQNDTIEITKFPPPPKWGGSAGNGWILNKEGYESMLGGIHSVLRGLYESSVNLKLVSMGVVNFYLTTTGQASSNYLTSDVSTYSGCTMTWEDPTADIINTVYNLMFRSAIAYSNSNASAVVPQQLPALETRVANAYQSHYKFLGITIGCMILQALAISYLLLGWHRLGRQVSLSALEIARALEAPLLQNGSSNNTIGDHLSSLRPIKLRYGEILPESTFASSCDNRPGQQFQPGLAKPSHQDITSEAELSHFLATHEKGYDRDSLQERPVLGFREEGQVGDIRPNVLY